MMPGRWSLRIGRLFGIDVAIDVSWLLIFALLTFSLSREFAGELGVGAASALVFAAVTTLLMYASVLAHEYGHALTARFFGIHTARIILHLFGGVAFLESEPRRPRDEFWITVAGPAVSFVLAALFGAAAWVLYLGDGPAHLHLIVQTVAIINLSLGIFNCLPGFPMDGGRVVRSAIWAATGNLVLATRIAALGGGVVGLLLMGLGGLGLLLAITTGDAGFAMGGMLQLLLGGFLINLAWSSARQTEIQHKLDALKVHRLMRPVSAVVPADLPVARVMEAYRGPNMPDQFPVVDGPRLLGNLSLGHINALPERQWEWVRARELARPYQLEHTLDLQTGALDALRLMHRLNRSCAPVFEGRRLVGYVFHRDIAEALGR